MLEDESDLTIADRACGYVLILEQDQAVSRIRLLEARSIRAGVVWVNTFDTADITVPFGGFKQSGFGRDKGMAALDGYTQLKTTWFDLSGK